MKVPFLDWLRSQNISEEANTLFNESVECYKASAYRAALLFSFLGFQTVLRDRILEAETPKGYKDSEWTNLQKGFRDEDNWDKKVIDIVANKKKPVFSISEDLYEQYFYWKNRRNDCAHAKGNIIEDPHVQAFWYFIQSNLMKFRVNGSKEYIIQQIKVHFDPKLTPPNSSIKPILIQIPHTVDQKDILSFFEELIQLTFSNRDSQVIDTKKIPLWECLFEILEGTYFKTLIKLLIKPDNRLFVKSLFFSCPNLIKYFHEEKTFIRSIWKGFFLSTDYDLYIEMIRYNLIPKEEISESIEYMIDKIPADFFEDYEIHEMDIYALKQIGFFDSFYKKAFVENTITYDFKWGNLNAELVIFYLDHYEIDGTIASAIKSAREHIYPPRHLLPKISEFFKRNPDKKEKYDEFLAENF